MRTRPLRIVDTVNGPSDLPRLEEMWEEKGFACNKPDFSQMGGTVLVDNEGVIREAVLDRKTVELYFLVDHGDWAQPGMKWTQFERLHEAERVSLQERGYTDVHAWVPRVARTFAHKLKKFFGWVNSSGPDDDWAGLTREL